jgi:hypothetical protein
VPRQVDGSSSRIKSTGFMLAFFENQEEPMTSLNYKSNFKSVGDMDAFNLLPVERFQKIVASVLE